MNTDKVFRSKICLTSLFDDIDVLKETLISIIECLSIQIIYNESIIERDEMQYPYFKINNSYFSGYDYILFIDKINIKKFIQEKREGRKKCLGGVYKLIDNSNVCRIIDFEKDGESFIYTVEILNDRFNSTEFYGVKKVREEEIGRIYSEITTPYIDPDEHSYEKWIEPEEVTKNEFY